MAAKPARRWYQFSLRALLLLTVVSGLPLGIYVGYRSYLEAKRRAQIEASFRWLESLGYPELPNDKPVRVTTLHWQGQDKTEEPHRQVSIGFLLREDAKSFTVLTPALRTVTYERESREWGRRQASFEPAELRVIAPQVLEQVRSKNLDYPFDRIGLEMTLRGEHFVLAWTCWRQGHIGLAKDLYALAEADPHGHDDPDLKLSFVDRLAADFAYMETWRATRACGTLEPRPELLKKFRRLQKSFPKSKYADDVAQKVVIFEQMVAEDELHAKERAAGVPFKELSQSEQIAELIFQLRDQNGQQFSQPGSCDVLDTASGREDSPGHRLVEIGYDAIPQLAAALGDERLTRSIGFHRDFYFSHHVLTVGDAAEQLLERIASRNFEPSERNGSDAERVATMRNNALAWHAELAAKGEQVSLVEAVERADDNSVSLARRLMKKHPDAACSAILRALEMTEDEYDRASFLHLLGRIPNDESFPVLCEELQHKTVAIRIAAAEALTALNRTQGIDEMLRQWESCPKISEFEGLGPFLARCGRADAAEAVTKRFSEQSIDERLETMDEAADRSPEEFAARPELRTAVIGLLLVALRDTDVRSGIAGSRGDKSFSDPRVCDLAGYHLNELDPAAFPFDLGASFNQRERERLAILATHAKP